MLFEEDIMLIDTYKKIKLELWRKALETKGPKINK